MASGAVFLFCSFLSLICIAASWGMAYQLTPPHKRTQHTRWLVGWAIKGVAVPLLVWALMNFGLSWELPPFMPQIQAAQNKGAGWFLEFLAVVAGGLFFICSYWAPGTLGWALARMYRGLDADGRANMKDLCRTWAIGMSIPVLVLAFFGGWWTLGLAAFALLAPIGGTAPRMLGPVKLPPMYARAIARMKFGKYAEAEWEIIRELEKREDDFQGWMMLAELYATRFHDLPEAEQTILEICDQPRTSPSQLSIALHRLADWQLEMAGDPDPARRSLQMICDRLPGSHLAHMAQLRLKQLPATPEALREEQTVRPIPLPALGDHFDEAAGQPQSPGDRAKAAEAAKDCVERLNRDPNNIPARETLARLLAEQLQQAERGIEQLTLLLGLPGQPERTRAEWCSLIAAWHLKHRHDVEAGRGMLERIIREFPRSPQALAARRRLQLMAADENQSRRSEV
jgi:hypothetical protein